MPPSSCTELVDSYVTWLRSRFSATEVGGACEITTPFLDRHNDYMQVYVKRTPSGYVLTDDGYTINDLVLSGCDLSSGRRKELLTTITNGFGVQVEGEELATEARPETFAQRKHALIQAMLTVNDMFMTAQPHVASLFLEDVEQFLHAHSVRYVPKVHFTGKSGFSHGFDFAIPASRSSPDRVVRAINHPDRNSITAFLFAWSDIRETRPPNAMAYAILNDLDRPPASDVSVALRQYGAKEILWSRREERAPELAA